ncbi:neprilysin-4-like [Eurosta solidaginis]|uniref:neprilysin-4-like n=1 Tax=Eurosta solidaginis TaxID=178769 RepID=UPI0035316A8A
MLKLSIICTLFASIIWRTTPTNCSRPSGHGGNVNQILATNIQNYMDTTARPCENFYQYACGHWPQQHIEQLDFGDTLGLLDYELNRKLEHLLRRHANASTINAVSTTTADTNTQTTHNDISTDVVSNLVKAAANTALLEGPYAMVGDLVVEPQPSASSTTAATSTASSYTSEDALGEPLIYEKARIYYRSCKKVKPYNLKKYLQLIQPGFGAHWCIMARNGGKKWHAEQFDWLKALAKLRLYGLNGVLLKEEVLPRWDESNSNSIYLDKPNLAETEPTEEGVMIELLLDIGQTKRAANEVARELNTFSFGLHKLQEIEDEEGAKEMQLGYLQEYMPEINWLEFLTQLKGASTTPATTVIIQNIPYMRALVRLLADTPKETQCNYIMLKLLLYLKQRGPAEISKHECISSLRRAMPLAMSYIIGRHYYKDAAQNDENVQEIFAHLQQKFYEIVSDNRLQLQRPIVDTLLQKISSMRLQVGNSLRNVTPEYYDDYYERVELDPNNFYVNQLSLLRLAVERSHESLEHMVASNFSMPENETYVLMNWIGSSSSPFYVKPKNMIIVPYSYLQMPIYHRGLRDIFKYSVLGFSIAHELLHGFDSSGIDYDSAGNIMGPSEEIAANQRFIHGLRCMQNELATGSRSLNEKLADYEGFRLAYETYFNGNVTHRTGGVLNKLLPQFSDKQLFFINFAQFFCSKVQRSLRKTAYLEHAIDELRVLQTLANFEEFSSEFSCERRAKMQSKHRCKLW